MSLEAERDGLPPPMDKAYPESAASELLLQPQDVTPQSANKVNGTYTLTAHTAAPHAALPSPALTSNPVHIPPLSSATADLVAQVNGNSGQPESSVNGSQSATDDTVRSQPQPGQAAVTEETLNIPQTTTNHTWSPSADATVHSSNPDNISSTNPHIVPSAPLRLPEQQSNMVAGPSKSTATPNGTKSPGTPKKTTASAGAIAPASTNPAPNAAAPKRKATTAPRGSGSKRTKRRKSGKDEDDDGVIKAGDSTSDESDEPAPTTTQTKSGRQINRPLAFAPPSPQAPAASPANQASQPPRKRRRLYRKGRENNITCLHCQRSHSAPSNAIVFCDDCNGAWHQFCHDPPIKNGVVTVKEAQWFCSECKPAEGDPATRGVDERPSPVALETEKVPLPSEVLVGGSRFSQEQRRGYLAGLSHAALVKLLVDVSFSQPELPLFPENLPDLRSCTLFAPPLRARKVSKATIVLSGSENTVTATTASPAPAVAAAATAPAAVSTSQSNLEQTTSNDPAQPLAKPAAKANPAPHTVPASTNDDDTDGYLEHRLYPKAGNGFCLPPISDDLDMLLEDPACTTFSHALHGPAKARAEANTARSIGSVA